NELALLALMEIQEHWGYCSEDAAVVVADHLGVELQRVYALLTFYGDLRTTPRAANVYIACDGAACNTLGSDVLVDRIIDRLGITRKGQTSPDGKVTMEIFSGCMGACQIGPIATVNGKAYGHLTPEKVDQILIELIEKAVIGDGVWAEKALGWLEPAGLVVEPPLTLAESADAAGLTDYKGIPPLKRHPFLRRQTRWLARRWGRIDPESIEEYIA